MRQLLNSIALSFHSWIAWSTWRRNVPIINIHRLSEVPALYCWIQSTWKELPRAVEIGLCFVWIVVEVIKPSFERHDAKWSYGVSMSLVTFDGTQVTECFSLWRPVGCWLTIRELGWTWRSLWTEGLQDVHHIWSWIMRTSLGIRSTTQSTCGTPALVRLHFKFVVGLILAVAVIIRLLLSSSG